MLAAGAGRRMGSPKALVRDPDGVTWVVRAAPPARRASDCSPVVVVVGAAAEQVRAELADEPVEVVEATNWSEGMGASLRAGLTCEPDAEGRDRRRRDRRCPRRPGRRPGPDGRRRPADRRRSRSRLARAVVRRTARSPGAARARPLGRRDRLGSRGRGGPRVPQGARSGGRSSVRISRRVRTWTPSDKLPEGHRPG